MEPDSPLQNTPEGMIHEVKKESERKMVWSGAPKAFWDDCIELEAEIWSSTVHNVFELDGEMLKMDICGETTNISHICEYGWYDRVYCFDANMA